jgi:hypothetical protein
LFSAALGQRVGSKVALLSGFCPILTRPNAGFLPDHLFTEQMKLGRFRPWVQHSFEEGAKPVVFHPQMLADFTTVDELGHTTLAELNR